MRLAVVYIAIFVFGISSLGPNMQGAQLLKLPELTGHVRKHFGDDWTWGEFKEFIFEHYACANLPYEEEHKDLPFKTITMTPCHVICTDQQWLAIELHTDWENPEENVLADPDNQPIDRPVSIWTPPQLMI